MSVFLHLRAGVVGTKVYIFDECFPTIPVSSLQGTRAGSEEGLQ